MILELSVAKFIEVSLSWTKKKKKYPVILVMNFTCFEAF